MASTTDKIDKKINAIYESAVAFEKKGEFQNALQKLLEMIGYKEKYDVLALTMMGNIYWNLGNLGNAIKYFRQAIQIRPKFETASLGLFHTLWENGETQQAFEEVKRFLSQFNKNAPPPREYLILLDELNIKIEESGG